MSDGFPHSPRAVVPAGSALLLAESFDRGHLTGLRHTFATCAEASGLNGQRLDDFVVAVNELITNAVRHGGGRGSLRLWLGGRTLVCEVSDSGGGITVDRLGHTDRPSPDTAGGWGLWLASKLSDDMSVETGPAGTTVRVSATCGRAARRPEPAE